jgi:thiamine-phosphate pyrophosphorylase
MPVERLSVAELRRALRNDLRLYLCTDRILSLGRPITGAVEQAIAGGVTMVQLREKDASSREFYEIAVSVTAITRAHHIPLIINDRLDIALAAGAEGLHIGQSDLPLKEARRIAGNDLIIGVSTHNAEEARKAEAEGADYIGAGAIYPTGSKADAGNAIGVEALAAICAAVKIPVVGIGGIGPLNAAGVMGAGAAGIAVISAILSQENIEKAARNLRAVIG